MIAAVSSAAAECGADSPRLVGSSARPGLKGQQGTRRDAAAASEAGRAVCQHRITVMSASAPM
jgi:hypothetical protein